MRNLLIGLLIIVLGSASAWAWDVETVPIGGMEIDETGAMSRARLSQELSAIEKAHKDRPFIETRAAWLVAIMDNVRLAVNTNDLFVHWHPDGRLLEERKWQRLSAFRASSPERALVNRWHDATEGSWVGHMDTSHTCPDWESILAFGPKGLADRARKRLATAGDEEAKIFLSSVVEVYEAMSRFCLRWADVAERRGMRDTADVLREIAVHPPRTLREALQLSLVYDRVQEDEAQPVRSQGLFDRLYLKFYRDDLAARRITREGAKALIRGVFDCYSNQGHPNCKNIAFGGYDEAGKVVWNEITEIAFEVHYETNRHNPKLTYRYGSKTPSWQLEKVSRCMAAGRTSIVFANDDVLFEMFRRRGKTERDLASYVLIGCYEPGIQGEAVASMAGQISLAKPLEAVLNGGCSFKGRQIGPACELPTDGDAFEREYLRQLGAMIEQALATSKIGEEHWYELNPAPLMSGAFRDCVERGRDYSHGGSRYQQSGIVCVGLGTMADSLAAVRYLVDEQKLVTMAELAKIVKDNWKGHEELRLQAMRKAPKWGNNDSRADEAAKRVYDFVAGKINATPNGRGGKYQAGFWSIYLDMEIGNFAGATPDGRLAGRALSRNNVATDGCGREGPTALLRSMAKLDQANSPDGFIADVILPVTKLSLEEGTKTVSSLLAGYAKMGGQCIHMNVFDSAVLRDAMAHPEKYPDLQVRVCGWNVRWNDLSKQEQLHFLATAEAQGM